MNTLQYQLSSGTWSDCSERSDEFIDLAAAYNKQPRDVVVAQLGAGKRLRHGGDEWYQMLRNRLARTVDKPRPSHAPRKVCGEPKTS